MKIDVKLKIKQNPNNSKFLKENSYWYKYLNRNQSYYIDFENAMKVRYKLTPEDRMSKMREGIDTLTKIIDILS